MNLNLAICDDEMSDMKILTTHIEHYNIVIFIKSIG